MVHHRPGSSKLTNEKSYARLTDRERSVLAGYRAMYPPVRGDRVARKGDTARDRDRRRRSGVDVRIWRRAVVRIVIVLLCQKYNNKRGLIRVV